MYTTKNGLADDGVLSLNEGADGSLWVGTRGGFSRLRNGEFESFLPQDGLSQSSVSSLYEDREGSLWAGTKLRLESVRGRPRHSLHHQRRPSEQCHRSADAGSSSGGIWIGTLDAGLARFDGRRFSALGVRQGLASNMVLALARV